MAGVQLPSLNRIEPSAAQPKNDRINMKVQDQGAQILNRTQAITQVGHAVGDIYQKYEDDKIEQLGTQVDQEYSAWNNAELQSIGAKVKEGADPTDLYADYDKRAQEKYDEIISRRPDISERVRRHVTGRLDRSVSTQNVAVLKQRGAHQEIYSNNVFEAGVKSKKDNLSITAGYVQKGDQSSYLMYDQNISDIKTMIAKRGMNNGTVKRLPDDAKTFSHAYMDDEGKVVKVSMNDFAKQRAAKEISEGVKSSLDVMIAGGQVETAKEMREKYKDYLDPASTAKVDNKIANKSRKQDAYKFIGSLNGKSDEAKVEAIEKIQDPELRSEALKIKDADDAKLESMRKRKDKVNYDTFANRVIEKMSSDQPYNGLADLEADPLYDQTWDNLSPKSKLAIQEMVLAPKNSDPDAELRVQSLFLGNGDKQIDTITPEDFARETVGLSKSAKAKYTNMYLSLRTQTEGEKRAMYKQAGDMLTKQFLADGHIKKDKYGNINQKDNKVVVEANNKLIQHLSTQYGAFNPAQLQKFVKDFSADEIKGKVFNPQSRTPAVKPPDKAAPAGQIKIGRTQYNNLVRLYSKKNNGTIPEPNDPKFINFVQQNL